MYILLVQSHLLLQATLQITFYYKNLLYQALRLENTHVNGGQGDGVKFERWPSKPEPFLSHIN